MCHFQQFLKFQLSNNFSCGPLFAKIPKMTIFIGLGNRRLRCVHSLVSVDVGPQRHFKCCGKSGFFQYHFGRQISEIEMLITRQVIVTATFPLHHPDHRFILHKICHFQPFLKFQLSNNFSRGHPFAKMPKMTNFSSLGYRRLRYVHSIASGTKALFFKCLIRTFTLSNFQRRQGRRWPAAAFQMLR